MISEPDWSVLDLDHLPEWPDYAAAVSSSSDGRRGIVAATMTPPNLNPLKVWIPGDMQFVWHKMTDRLVRDAVEVALRSEVERA